MVQLNIVRMKRKSQQIVLLLIALFFILHSLAAGRTPRFSVIAFYTAKNDQAHISFVGEANRWFEKQSHHHSFTYRATNNWEELNDSTLAHYQVVLFLDTRPEQPEQRAAFEKYMENGGAFLGFHFAAFALDHSAYPQNWDWYHNQLLGSGEYKGNTWRPTSAILQTEDLNHPVTKHLPKSFTASPNEWYSWKNDLRANTELRVLVSIHPSSFPLGTGPKPHEIWHEGDFPVVWTSNRYRMLYINMGHNDIDYENNTNKELSFTFKNRTQNRLVIDGLKWLGERN